jgi:GcrA cell cycle regulator
MGMNWTSHAVDRLRENVPASVIAEEFGITRNAVIGKRFRLGISFPTPLKVFKPKIVRPLYVREKRQAAERAYVLRHVPEPDNALRLTILEVKDSQCKWPVSVPDAEYRCCGHASEESKPYCAYHCRRAYA